MKPFDPNAEWLEADNLGGYASGTVSGIRTRRYHALLLTATTPPGGRVVLVNGFDAFVETSRGALAISSQRYAPDIVHPDGAERLESFGSEPWPHWSFRLAEDLVVEQELFVRPGTSAIFLSWKVAPPRPSHLEITLRVRLFFSGRDFHGLSRENSAFRFTAEEEGERVLWRPYEDLPAITAHANGRYRSEPLWYRNFFYAEEQARGLEAFEDLAAPGVFEFDITEKRAVLMLAADARAERHHSGIEDHYTEVRASEGQRRKQFPTRLHRSADAYVVRRGLGKTVIAGYPWFADWGRDAFIAMRGLCIATGRLHDAHAILTEWAGAVSEGMLPNRFPDRGDQPEYNSVDAALWYVIAVGDYLQTVAQRARTKVEGDKERLCAAIEAILTGYSNGTRFGIRADQDGLLRAGEPGCQLTWMDARVNGREVTPRIGKPVEVQALWLNALAIGAKFSPQWEPILEQGRESFVERFWNEEDACLFDVVDCDHQPGTVDRLFRPNQILAVGGLPLVLLPADQ